MKRFFLLGLVVLCGFSAIAQHKTSIQEPLGSKPAGATSVRSFPGVEVPAFLQNRQPKSNGSQAVTMQYLGAVPLNLRDHQAGLEVERDPRTGRPIFIKGSVPGVTGSLRTDNPRAAVMEYVQGLRTYLGVRQASTEFTIIQELQDAQGLTHWKLQQQYQGIPVYGGEAWVHANQQTIYLFNGRTFPTPDQVNTTPALDRSRAASLALADLTQRGERVIRFTAEQERLAGPQVGAAQLVIYHTEDNLPALSWYLEVAANVIDRWVYQVDAHSGAILHQHLLTCRLVGEMPGRHFHAAEATGASAARATPTFFDGPTSAVARDLLGVNRTIQTYLIGTTGLLLDVSRPMFNAAQSQIPGEPKGAIVTLDGGNNSPNNDNFTANYVTTTNNNWNNPTGVSAHFNAGQAYEYYRTTFNRNAINGKGGTIISIINVADDDGASMGNAFWNGAAMFYGNGDSSFESLARSLDVAGHEMTHGVIQSTANLEYQGESGALNESFADVFGVLMDRGDFLIGEDVVKRGTFPTGALRDLANPNNGGSRLGDPGWQPAHVDDQYRGTADNGGVHINSGIPNKAFHLFAVAVGITNAEKVYYQAMTKYLTRNAQFVDCRLAVMQAAQDIIGVSGKDAAAAAFAAVGIGTANSNPAPTPPPAEEAPNPGTQYILATDETQTNLYVYDLNGNPIFNPLTSDGIASKPSISDDGSLIVYVNAAKQLRGVEIDWQARKAQLFFFNDEKVWRNAVLSKDGRKLALLLNDFEPEIFVVDLDKQSSFKGFTLYNPTFAQGVSTGDVFFADGLEWDLSSQVVVYDALNEIKGFGTNGYRYYDIGLLHAFDNAANTFGDGIIEKIFTGIEEGESVGNPSISKNSPDIMAFDYLNFNDGTNTVSTINLTTGDIGTIFTGPLPDQFKNADLGFPIYSTDDDYLLFNARNTSGTPVVAFVPLQANKLLAASNAAIFKSSRLWGTWFATGSRVLTPTQDPLPGGELARVYPNPATAQLTLDIPSLAAGEHRLEIHNLLGQLLWQQSFTNPGGAWLQNVDIAAFPPGPYVLRLRDEKDRALQLRFVKSN